MASRNDQKLEKMRKQNEQLKRELAIQRVPVSVASAAYVAFFSSNLLVSVFPLLHGRCPPRVG